MVNADSPRRPADSPCRNGDSPCRNAGLAVPKRPTHRGRAVASADDRRRRRRGGPVGTFCLVLHSHLPWLAHHGRWPVGEEWLYQSWAHAYLPVVDVVRRLAAEGRRDLLTLGVTPVLAAQLDDPHCLRGAHAWLGGWLLRAHGAAPRLPDARRPRAPRSPRAALATFETHWRHGASAAPARARRRGRRRAARRAGHAPVRPAAAARGARVRPGDRPRRRRAAPRRPARRDLGARVRLRARHGGGYAAAGVRRFLVDGPALRGDTAFARPVGTSDVVAFGRDLDVTYRVWSPRAGYPGGRDYRDFHTYDHPSGLKPSRVTGHAVAPPDKQPYDPERAAAAVARDAADFVSVVRETADRPARAARSARAHGRGVRHRALRPLVARGPRLAGGGAARAARGGRAGDDPARRGRRRARRPIRCRCPRRRGARARTGGCGRASRSPTSSRRSDDVQKTLVSVARPRPDARPGGRRARPGGAAGAGQRLGVHGQQGLRGRLRARPRRHARRSRRRARPPPRLRADRRRAPPGGGVARYAVRPHRRPYDAASTSGGVGYTAKWLPTTTNCGHLTR